ncbi:MAG: hypothetical protein ACYDD6_06090, partial [Acidimicrobiales bacterium]
MEYVAVPPIFPGTYTEYLAWQVAAYRRAKRLHRQIKFDVVHHVTFANSVIPPWLGHLDIPFLWYAGSFTTTPSPFVAGLGFRSATNEIVRSTALRGLGRATRAWTLTPGTVTASLDPPPGRAARRWKELFLGALHPWELDLLRSVPVPQRDDDIPFRVLSV